MERCGACERITKLLTNVLSYISLALKVKTSSESSGIESDNLTSKANGTFLISPTEKLPK